MHPDKPRLWKLATAECRDTSEEAQTALNLPDSRQTLKLDNIKCCQTSKDLEKLQERQTKGSSALSCS